MCRFTQNTRASLQCYKYCVIQKSKWSIWSRHVWKDFIHKLNDIYSLELAISRWIFGGKKMSPSIFLLYFLPLRWTFCDVFITSTNLSFTFVPTHLIKSHRHLRKTDINFGSSAVIFFFSSRICLENCFPFRIQPVKLSALMHTPAKKSHQSTLHWFTSLSSL